MTCDPLPNTGLAAPVLVVAIVAVLCLLLGLGLVLRARRPPATAGATVLLVIVVVGAGLLATTSVASPAYATPTGCASPGPARPGPERSPASEHSGRSGQSTGTGSSDQPGQGTDPTPAANSLTITQTSTMADLAPGAAPAPITGLVVNHGPDSTFITAITVEISGVVRRPDAVAGPCDASDYVLLDERMPVGDTLAADGGSIPFAGAAIGFNDKSTNQDACQGATIELRYRTSA